MSKYMSHALELAAFGAGRVSPNPFVGAVIVHGDSIIGQGYHRNYGGPHAEVNAIRSVSATAIPLLRESTMYVTLEPCSHFGKTPPCANLIVETGIPRVVIAVKDPFLKQHGSGIAVLRDAGVDVSVGLMEKEARYINRRFFTAHTLRRPFILLKWAQTADGFIASSNGKPLKISTPVTQVLMHRERTFYDAIMVGVNTVICDNPLLNCRFWPVRMPEERPRKICFESLRLPREAAFRDGREILKTQEESLSDFISRLYSSFGIISLIIEGGSNTLRSFIEAGLYDEIRIETCLSLYAYSGIAAPSLPASSEAIGSSSSCPPLLHEIPPLKFGSNIIRRFVKNY